MHRLVILGSLGEFVSMIEMAKNRGIYTIVCDGYKNSPGKAAAHKAYDIDVGDIEAVAEMCRREKADGIITSFSDYLFECMVKIAEKAGLKTYFSSEKLGYYRDKTLMKDMLTELGIGTPSYRYIRRDFREEELAGLRFPVVAKPVDKYGSRGVRVLYEMEEISREFDEICATSDNKTILVEEYDDGYEFNMMTWVLHGAVQVISIADREKSPIGRGEIPISSRNVYPSRLIDRVYEEAKDILQKVADRMGQESGPLSMQFFWKPGEPIKVCEVAGRFFGYEHELVPYAGGADLEKLLLDYVYEEEQIDKTFAAYSPFFQKVSAVLYFHGKPGMTVADQSRARELASYHHIVEDWIFYREGETIVLHGPNPYAARYYLTAETREEADEISAYMFEHVSIRDEEGKEVLYQNKMTAYDR